MELQDRCLAIPLLSKIHGPMDPVGPMELPKNTASLLAIGNQFSIVTSANMDH